MENNYYVYEHIRNDNQTSFYVGKGSGNRAFEFHRNDKHDSIANEYGYTVNIIKDNLSESDAYDYERTVIEDYIYNKGYGIDIDGLEGEDKDRFLTNQTFGSKGSIGISNPMYGVSPKERMDETTYKEWFRKTSERTSSQIGDKNPNWKNDTLHNKLKNNPELKKQYYSRPRSKNGRSKKIDLYDLSWNYIKSFDCITDCAEYVKEKVKAKGRIDSIRSNIAIFAKRGKPFLKHNYILH